MSNSRFMILTIRSNRLIHVSMPLTQTWTIYFLCKRKLEKIARGMSELVNEPCQAKWRYIAF